MNVEVNEVVRPIGLFDTMIKFRGTDRFGDIVTFAVDHRPARDLIGAMQFAAEQNDPPILAHVEDWQILSRRVPR